MIGQKPDHTPHRAFGLGGRREISDLASDVVPPPEDAAVTRRLAQAGELVGIAVLALT